MQQNITYFFLALVLIASTFYILKYPIKKPVFVNQNNSTSTVTLTPTSITTATATGSAQAAPSPASQSFSSPDDHFSISYDSSRKLYQDTEFSGNRYTLYSSAGNIAIHVGKIWSWTSPLRKFTNALLVANQPTYVYDIPTQTITDFQYNGKDYTFQCVHNGLANIKSECTKILQSFKLL